MPKVDFIKKLRIDASELRKGIFEFQGFEREFILFQKQLLSEYEKSSGLKHPVNRGDAREDYLRTFFNTNGLIPEKYGISETSSRVVSSSGHHSEELDILFFDRLNNISLLKYQNTEFYPVEFVHGIIQVKSCLRNKKTIKDGLKNIASFKKLRKSKVATNKINDITIKSSSTAGFGVLFAYKATLKWLTIISAIKEFMADNPSSEWPNAVVILDEGVILPFENNQGYYKTADVGRLTTPDVMGRPDQGDCLLTFYSILMDLLDSSILGGFELSSYFRLPLKSGVLSYSFTFGPVAEIGQCKKHGQFLREISQDSLKKIVNVCSNTAPINWIKATELAYGYAGDNEEAYVRQPGDVYIYNPDGEELSKILIYPEKPNGLAFDSIEIEGKIYWVPYVYSIRDNLVTVNCPKCKKP